MGFSGHFKARVPVEDHDDVAAAEQETAHRVALLHCRPRHNGVFKVDRGYLAHDNIGMIFLVPVEFLLPDDDPARAVGCRDHIDFPDCPADREVIPVIIVGIQEGMGQHPPGKGLPVLCAAQQGRYICQGAGLDRNAFNRIYRGGDDPAVRIDLPESLRPGIRRRCDPYHDRKRSLGSPG